MESGIALSNSDKKARSEAAKKERDGGEKEATIPTWVLGTLAVAILLSVFAQMYFSVKNNPSMSDER